MTSTAIIAEPHVFAAAFLGSEKLKASARESLAYHQHLRTWWPEKKGQAMPSGVSAYWLNRAIDKTCAALAAAKMEG